MKKRSFLFVAIISTFMLILAACGDSSSEGTTTKGEESSEKKPLRVVTNAAYAPFEYLDGDKIVGYDIDLINALAEEAGYEVEIEHVGWDPLFVEIESKRADLAIGAITINDERKQTYDFSHPYFLSTVKLLVPEDSAIQSGEDVKGQIVAVQTGTTGSEAVEKLIGKNHKDIKKFEDNNIAIQELLQGGADAVAADNTVVEEYVKNNPDQKLKVVADSSSFVQEFYGFMFPKGSELKTEFNQALNTLYDNGSYVKIYEKWFGVEPDLETLKEQQ